MVDDFAAFEGPAVLVLNPRAAGAGLNITAATVVIHFTQVWNPALELQASARAHRRGQTEPVTVYHLYYVDTVEEVMMEHKSLFDATMGQQCVGCSLCTSLPRMRDSSSSRRYPPRGRLRHRGTRTLHPTSRCPEHFPRPYWPAARRPRTYSLSLSLSSEIWQRVQISTER